MVKLSSDIDVDVVDYATALDALRAVREPVFVMEQQVPREIECDQLDPLSLHVLARDRASGEPIGTGRLTPELKIGRMAVLPEWRNRGVGAALLVRLLDLARERGIAQVSLHAQVGAIDFYRQHGFETYGERYMEAGIEHQSMRRQLAPIEPPAQAPAAVAASGIGYEFDTLIDCRIATLAILAATRHQLCIYSRDLEPLLLGEPDALEQLRRIGLSGRGAEIRVLVHDPAAVQHARSPLLALLQRLGSAVEIRQPVEDVDLQYASAFVVNDQGGYVFRPLASRFDGYGNSHDGGRQHQLQDYFRQVWQRAQVASELRTLRL